VLLGHSIPYLVMYRPPHWAGSRLRAQISRHGWQGRRSISRIASNRIGGGSESRVLCRQVRRGTFSLGTFQSMIEMIENPSAVSGLAYKKIEAISPLQFALNVAPKFDLQIASRRRFRW